MKPFYITTSIAYPNADPHIGYALELVQADFLARYYRLQGREVYFLTGLDEHGLKIQRAAEKEGVSTPDFVNKKAEVFQKLCEVLGLSQDRFIRTSEPAHYEIAQALWKRCLAKGDIYKKQYRAWYNVKEEEFLGLADEQTDPSIYGVDPAFVELIDEENYFFRLSRYKEEIIKLLESGQYKVVPEGRRQELLNFVKEHGLEDISVSREKSKLAWGIPVQGDENQVMYVWFDALTNYLTAAAQVENGELILNERWPADLHCIGKDISRFHALIWPGMLLSADLALPKELLVHGFITSGGQKMSKSVGNVVDPLQIIDKYGQDVTRWFLLKEITTSGDGDFTVERLAQVYAADLANNLGNLVSRVWTLWQKASGGVVDFKDAQDLYFVDMVKSTWENYHNAVGKREIHLALQGVYDLVVACNKYIEEQKPWVSPVDKRAVLYNVLEVLRQVTLMLGPALPDWTNRMKHGVFSDLSEDEYKEEWGLLPLGLKLGTEKPMMFPRLP